MRMQDIQTLALAAEHAQLRSGLPAKTSNGTKLPRQRLLAILLASGTFMLAASAASADGGDTQATATCAGSLPYNDTGTTVSKVDDYDLPADTSNPTMGASCASSFTGKGPAGSLPHGAVYTGTGTAPDAVYRLDFPAGNTDTLTISMDPTGAQDLSLVVYCNAVSSNPADGLVISDTGAAGATESVSLSGIAPGTSLYVVVDGYSTGATPPGPSGPYTLSVTSSGTTQPDSTCGATPTADLAITKTDGVTSATPGGSVTYTITASNAGPSNAPGSTVVDTFPASETCTWTCVGAGGGTCTAAGSGNINGTVNLPAGGSTTYTASCSVSAAATGSLSNTATVTAPAGVTDGVPGNNSATDTDTLAASADLAITKTDGVTSATPGGSVTYTITASNAGPSNASGSTVADTFPASETCTWTCAGAGGGTCTAAGSGNINDTVNLPAGGSTTYTASCAVSAAATGTLSNTATVTAPSGVTDSSPGNNTATDTDTLGASADLTITKTDGVTSATPGGSVTYTITASNAGPSNAPGSTVADTFPASETCTWTCTGAGGGTCTAAGSGNINDTVNLPAGGSTTYTASCSVSAAATGTLSNTATVTAPAGVTDSSPGNNSATDTDTLAASADLAVSIGDSPDPVTVGDDVTYTVSASNAGPSNASDVSLSLPLPANTGFASVIPSGAGTCTMPTVGSGGTVTCTWVGNTDTVTARSMNVAATVLPLASGALSATATVSASSADANPGNDSATATTTITGSADLVLSFSASPTPVAIGDPITFIASANNLGPSAAPNLVISIALDPLLSFTSSTADSSGTCTTPAVGSGGTVVCTWATPTLPGESHNVTVVAAGNTAGETSTIASASSDVSDPTPADAQSSTTITIAEAFVAVNQIPTLDRLGLLLLAGFALVFGAFKLRRSRID